MFSFIHRKEPYVSWKGNTSKSEAVPSWSRPIQNDRGKGVALRALPLAQWRKQLIPEPKCNNANSSTKIIIGSLVNTDSLYCDSSCNPEKNVIKSAVVSISDKHHNSSASYMESRCMLYRQKLTTIPIEGTQYVTSNGGVIWPSDDSDGTQNRSSIGFSNEVCGSNVAAIYKPNNNQFSNQGAVDSSSRSTRLKYNTIYKNGRAFSTAWDASAANAGKYTMSIK